MRSIVCEQTLLFALLVASTSIGSFVLAGTAHSNHHRQHHNNRQSTFKHHQQPYRSAQEIKGCRRYQHRGAGEDPCTKLLREEHRVGALPWENGHEPIPESFAGHLPIRSWQQDEYHGETSMFYWYFPAIKPKVEDPPLLIWLQGGPGSTSLIGLFYENGPIQVNEKLKLERREFHWAEEYSIVFIDQPVGTGYSYVTRVPDSSNSSSSSRMQDPKRMEDQLLAALDQELEEDQTREQKFLADLLQTLKTRDQKDGRVKGKKGVDKSAASFEHMIRTRASRYSNGYVKDQRGVVSDMLIFLDQFYLRFPEVRSKDLYITGESYAGKFVPAVATGILERNKKHTTDCPVNDGDDDDEDEYDMGGGDKDRCRETRPRTEFIFPLKGVAMGNGLSDPVSQVQVHADQCYFAGVITKAHADQMRTLQEKAVREVETGRLLAANQYRLDMFEVFRNATGGLNWYDIRKGSVPNDWTMMELFVNSDPVKDALNVFGPRMAFLKEHGVPEEEIQRIEEGRSRTQHSKDMAVIKAMEGDIMRSSVWMISSLLQQGIKVLIYQGMFDFRDGPAGSHRWVDQLEWPGQAEFLKTERELWKNDMGRLAGYVTQVPGLSRVTILGAGHLAMMDQSKNSLTMISSFIEGKKLGDPTSED